jgi:hypothetical protein
VFGRQLADNIRTLFAPTLHPKPTRPYEMICSCGGDSYIAASISSLWALLVVLIAFTAGLTFPFKRRIAGWMLCTGAVISVLDTGMRSAHHYQYYPPDGRQMMIDGLPGQLVANCVFQFGVPFPVGLIIALLSEGLKQLIAAGWVQLRRPF